MEFDAKPGKIYHAKVKEISKNTTSNNLSYLLTALLPNREERLPAECPENCSCVLGRLPSRLGSLFRRKPYGHRPVVGDYVWTLNPSDNRVLRKCVTLGNLLPGGEISVTGGLNSGETVIVSGLRFLSENYAGTGGRRKSYLMDT